MWNVNSDGKYSCHKEFTAVDVGNLANAVYSSCLEFWVYTQDNRVLWVWWTAGYGCLLNEYNITPTPHVLWGLGFEISISKPSQRDFKSKTSGTEFQGPSKNNSLSKEVFSQDIRGEKKTWCCYFFWMNNDVRVSWLVGLFFFSLFDSSLSTGSPELTARTRDCVLCRVSLVLGFFFQNWWCW